VQEALSHESYAWTLDAVTDVTRRLLGALPFRIDLQPLGGHVAGPTVTLVHGTPVNNVTYWEESRSNDFCTRMASSAGLRPGDLIAFGHTHKPWHRRVGGVELVNTGRGGRPKDGDPRAGDGIQNVGPDGSIALSAERVAYDVEAAVRGIRASTLPDAFGEFLRTGGKPQE
jgi:hypothetical protein